MAKTEMTEEQRAERLAQLARGRQTAAENRVKKLTAEAEAPAASEETVAPVGDPEVAARRRIRLFGDDAEAAAMFTDAELETIEREEIEKARADKRKQALSDVRSIARQHARIDNDLIPANTLRGEAEKRRLAELVTFKVSLPGDGAGHRGQNGLRVDGRLYQNGRTYTETRAVFESLHSNYYKAWLGEIKFKTLDQHKPGNSAVEIMHQTIPSFEVRA